MESCDCTERKTFAFRVTLQDGRSTIAYALNNGTAKNRGAKQLGSRRTHVSSCVRSPGDDAAAPNESCSRKKMGRPLPDGVFERELEKPHERYCTKCNEFRPADDFSTQYKYPGRECKRCRAERYKNLTEDQRKRQLVSAARHRARTKGLQFNITSEDIEIPDKCPVLGIEIKFSKLAERHNSPSLDRIKPELGYIPGNIIVVSWLANDIRRNFDPKDIVTVGNFYKQFETAAKQPEL